MEGEGLIFSGVTGVEQREAPDLEVNVKVSKSIGNRMRNQIHTGIMFLWEFPSWRNITALSVFSHCAGEGR